MSLIFGYSELFSRQGMG